MKNSTDFAKLVENFLTDYLPLQRNYSKNTISSYKDTFKLFVRFITSEKGFKLKSFDMSKFNRDIIISFLEWLRAQGCSMTTSNQRLAAIKSFTSFAQIESIENLDTLLRINFIKSKKDESRNIESLTVNQMKSMINTPDNYTKTGLRHKTILCLLYDTAARVQELCDITLSDIYMGNNPKVRLKGKGRKNRVVPITPQMQDLLKQYIKEFHKESLDDECLFVNRSKAKLTRDGIDYIVKKYASMINTTDKSFPSKVHPHMFRHSKAMHMLAAEIPLVYIRDFLGHEDIATTMIYARADNQLKEAAINKLSAKIVEIDNHKDWTKDNDLMDFLEKFK